MECVRPSKNRSRTFVLLLVGSSFGAFAYIGLEYFLIKILVIQFQKDLSSANEILTGVSFGSACAMLLGGYVSKRFILNFDHNHFSWRRPWYVKY